MKVTGWIVNLVGLNDSMAAIKARHMLKDKILTAVRFKNHHEN
jgi:hypothetical protein